jgi:DNA-binding Xre family transcriptional regulator
MTYRSNFKPTHIGDRLKEVMTDNNIGIVMLAKWCGVSRQVVYGWRKARSIQTARLEQLCSIFGMTVGEFLNSNRGNVWDKKKEY